MSSHSQEEKELIARIKARKIVNKFRKESKYQSMSKAQAYQKGVIQGMKEHSTISELEIEVLIQMTKL